MDSFSRNLPSTSGAQSIYEAIKLHDKHPAGAAGADDDGLEDAQIDEDNLEARFQDQDLDALLADAGRSTLTSDSASNPNEQIDHRFTADEENLADTNDLPHWTQAEASTAAQDEINEDVPASLLMEDKGSRTPFVRRNQSSRSTSRRPSTTVTHTPPRPNRDRPSRQTDDVPASLLLSDNGSMSPEALQKLPPKPSDILPPPVPGPSTERPRVRWDTRQALPSRQAEQRLLERSNVLQTSTGPIITDPTDRAMWMWANVENLDNFLAEVYEYHRGKGIWSISLSKLYELLRMAFVITLTVFLTSCVDYRKVPGSKHMSSITIPRCMSKLSSFSNLLLWTLMVYWIWQAWRILVNSKRLWSMHEFFTYALHITENELQTITWQSLVSRLMNLRDANARTALEINPRNRRFIQEPSKQRMDAHDIANRLMRRDNYLIALFNKDILNLTLPLPFLRDHQFFSRNLEWNIHLCVLDYVFNETGQISQLFLRDSHRHELIAGLRRRFLVYGFVNIVSAPFLVMYFLTLYFLRYFTEFQKNPSRIGSRSYTPLAEWKFREFNELNNFFERRLNMSKPFANRYLNQFPKDKTSQSAGFIAFIAGSLAAVLGTASLLDPDVFLGFEITPERTVLFYLGVFGTIWAVARGMVAEDEDSVFDPEYAITNVADYTRYMPSHWRGRLHTEEVRKEFAQLYQMRIVIFLEEMLSIVFTPFVLWFSLPDCSARIVDFFREFTIHVDGLGYVCSFALFEFQKDGVSKNSAPPGTAGTRFQSADERRSARRDDPRRDYFATKDNKMLSSYYSFIDSYANNPTGKAFNRAHDRRIFRPPPAFPSIHEEATSPRRDTSSPSRERDLGSSQRRSSRQKHLLDESALAPSLLLDPAHRPSRDSLRPPTGHPRDHLRQSRTGGRPTPGRHKSPLSSPPYNHDQGMESIALQEDEELGDSWRTLRDGLEDREREDAAQRRREEEQAGAGDAGVLGLLYEYQKAQTEGRKRGSIGV